MQGIGMTPEAIENSPMMYELLWDMTWTKDPIDYREWVQDYAERIYGGTNEDIQRVWGDHVGNWIQQQRYILSRRS